VGVASNKLLAKIASDLNKPDGMCRIGADNVRQILDGLPIEKLFGVGPKSLPGVHAAGIFSFGDLRLAGEEALWRAFGKHGRSMQNRACGIDDRPVEPNREEKSISAEETYATDLCGAAALTSQILHLADRAAARLRAHQLAAGCVNVKIRRADFTTYTRQRALAPPTQDTTCIAAAARELLHHWLAAQPDSAVRLLGVGVSQLQTLPQGDLFGGAPGHATRLDTAIDGIRGRFGSDKLTRASLLSGGSNGSGTKA
jgi:DNA polymerase-4